MSVNRRQVEFTPSAVGLPLPDEPDGLNICDSPMVVEAHQTTADETTYTLRTTHPPLHGRDLFYMLREVAPYKGYQTPGVVVDDWRLVDTAGKPGTESDRLMQVHAKLGQPWQTFMDARSTYVRMFDEIKRPAMGVGLRPLVPVILPERFGVGTVMKYVSAGSSKGLSTILDMVETEAPDTAHEVVYTHVAKKLNTMASGRDGIQQGFAAARPGQRQRALESLLDRYPLEVKQRVIAGVKEALFHKLQTDAGNDIYAFKIDGLTVDESAAPAVGFVDDGHMHDLGKPWRVATTDLPPALSFLAATSIEPVLQWTKQGDKRSIDMSSDVNAHMTGMMLASYLSPESHSHWPQRMKIRGSRNLPEGQELGVAQVPVLAMLRQHELFETGLLPFAEAAIEAS